MVSHYYIGKVMRDHCNMRWSLSLRATTQFALVSRLSQYLFYTNVLDVWLLNSPFSRFSSALCTDVESGGIVRGALNEDVSDWFFSLDSAGWATVVEDEPADLTSSAGIWAPLFFTPIMPTPRKKTRTNIVAVQRRSTD